MLHKFNNSTVIDMSKLFSVGIIQTEWVSSNPQFSDTKWYMLRMFFEVCTESHFFKISHCVLFDDLTISGRKLTVDLELRDKLLKGQLKRAETDQYVMFEKERNDLLEAWQDFKEEFFV